MVITALMDIRTVFFKMKFLDIKNPEFFDKIRGRIWGLISSLISRSKQ